MKSKVLFRIGFLVIILFLIITSYLWYLYFHNFEGEVLTVENIPDIEIINDGKIDYINAKIDDPEEIIPIYSFKVKNNTSNIVSYKITITDVKATEAKDGCTEGTQFKRNELKYELLREGKIAKDGLLSEVKDNTLYLDKIDSKAINEYTMRVWLNDENVKDTSKHYHYIIDVKVI